MPVIASPAYLSVNYEGRRRTLLAQWQRAVMPFELQQGYHLLLDAAAAHQCRFWIVDTSLRPASIDPIDIFWMLDTFFPQLQGRLGGTTYLAFLMAPQQLAGVLSTPSIPPLPSGPNHPYFLQRFTELAEARRWLRECAKKEG